MADRIVSATDKRSEERDTDTTSIGYRLAEVQYTVLGARCMLNEHEDSESDDNLLGTRYLLSRALDELVKLGIDLDEGFTRGFKS